MENVTGIGGVFFKADHPAELQKWYQETLGIPVGDDGSAMFHWREADAPERTGETVWSLFPRDTLYFDPSQASCMINYRVANLEQMLIELREARVTILGEVVEEYGRFAWVMDPEGNKIEPWEPPAPATSP